MPGACGCVCVCVCVGGGGGGGGGYIEQVNSKPFLRQQPSTADWSKHGSRTSTHLYSGLPGRP